MRFPSRFPPTYHNLIWSCRSQLSVTSTQRTNIQSGFMCWTELVKKDWSCGARAGYVGQPLNGSTFQTFRCAAYHAWKRAIGDFRQTYGVAPTEAQVPYPHIGHSTSFMAQYTTERPCRVNQDGSSACPLRHMAINGVAGPHSPGTYQLILQT